MDVAITGDRILYLYGVIPKDQNPPSDTDAPVKAVLHSAVCAIVEPVCAYEFSPDRLDEKMKSIEWVAGLAHKHETVLERAMRQGPVVPARLCTLFSNAETLRLSLAENEERFLAALKRVQDREEWGLKVFCCEDRLRTAAGPDDPQVRALDAAMAKASPGQAFIIRKRREARLADVAANRTDAVADQTLEALARQTADMRLRPLLSETATGRREPMVLNVAALVAVTARESFHSTIARQSERFQFDGFIFEVSGPWPPYSFCDDEDGAWGANPEELMSEEER